MTVATERCISLVIGDHENYVWPRARQRFGSGEVDMVGTIRALKDIDYKGQIYPEHFPAIAGDHAAGLAWTIGYIRALDQAL